MNENDSVTLANPCHPGEILREWIDGHGVTVTAAAQRMGMSRAMLNRILSGASPVSPKLAVRLERMHWSDAEFWCALQTGFDLARERRETAA